MSLLNKRYRYYMAAESSGSSASSSHSSSSATTSTTTATTTLSNATLAVKDKSGNVGYINSLTSSDITKIKNAISATGTNASAINTLSANLSSEITARADADATLQANINTNAGNISAVSNNLSTEIAERKDAVSNLTSLVDSHWTDTVNSVNNINSRIVTVGDWQNISGYKSFNGGLGCAGAYIQYIELSSSYPYIDFHYDNSTADYTSRIAESSAGNLFASGNFTANVDLRANCWAYAVVFKSTSDRNLKKDFQEVTYDLSNIKAYRYRFKDDKDDSFHVGLIAQDVQEVIPEAVTQTHSDQKGDYLTLDYNAVVAALVTEVNALKKRLEKLENK